MILLSEVAKKIENILNGVDPEVVALGLQRPTGYLFKVATEGFHIDSIADMGEGKNFIPVFISSMGGNFNPVPDLMQANYVIPVAIYFPVRFKDDLYRYNEYLARVFVGRQLHYGQTSGSALSNLSVAQYGEIVDMDLKQFMEWARTEYKMPLERMEPFLQMTFSLYLSTASSEFIYGNDAKASLSFTYDSTTYTDSEITFVQGSIQSSCEPASQQMLGENESESLPVGASYGYSFSVYVKNLPFYTKLIELWMDAEAQELAIDFTFNFLGTTKTRVVYIHSTNLIIQKGELATITFSFSKKAVVDDGGL